MTTTKTTTRKKLVFSTAAFIASTAIGAIKRAIFSTAALALASSSAFADGLYDLYSIGGANPMGTIEIKDDVTIEGTKFVSWWVPRYKMMIYIPPEAAYVTMQDNSPLNGKKFEGGWFSHKSKAELGSAACEDSEKDETGKERFLGGDLTWTLYVNKDDYNFEISLGSCDDPVRPWAQNTNAKG